MKWTWVVGVVALILLAIFVAVIGGIVADSKPTPTWFHKDILHGHNLTIEPSTLMLGAALFPVLFGTFSLAHGTYLRVTRVTPDGRHARPSTDD